MSAEPFLCPRLIGARFEGHAVPLEFLKDLAALEEMIVEAAKAEFLKDHPYRQRVRSGFAKGIELKLTEIEEGSAVLTISLDAGPDLQFPRQDQTYFERALEVIAGIIRAAEQNQSVTDYLPHKILRHFGKFGRSLRDDEAIEFITPTRYSLAKLTKKTWLRLIQASDRLTGESSAWARDSEAAPALPFKALSEETFVRGTVPEADQDNMTFEIQPIIGQKVKAPIPLQHLSTILGAFSGYKSNRRVLLHGIGRFSRDRALLGFDSIEHVSIIDALDISARLDELRLMKNGWLEGKGLAPPHVGLDWLSRAFDDHYPGNLPLPYLYPTEEGGIQAEWTLGPKEVSLEIELSRHSGEWHVLDMETNDVSERTLNIEDVSDWRWLAEQIRQMNQEEE